MRALHEGKIDDPLVARQITVLYLSMLGKQVSPDMLGQITAVECGIMSFEAAFMPHILLPTGERIIDKIKPEKLLAGPRVG